MAIEHRMRPHLRGQVMHQRQLSQTIPCISRTVKGQPGHSLLQASMPDDEELECALSTKSSARAQALEDALRKERTRADQGMNVCVHVCMHVHVRAVFIRICILLCTYTFVYVSCTCTMHTAHIHIYISTYIYVRTDIHT